MAQDPIRIVIECEGGLVRTVYSSLANVEAYVVDWDTAEGFRSHEEFRASEAVADPGYFDDLQRAGILRPASPEEEVCEYTAFGLTISREDTPHVAW